MCTAVVISTHRIERVFWDPDDLAIYVPPGTTLLAALPEIRAILNDLSAPLGPTLTCWCGDPITLPDLPLEEHRGTPTH